MQQASHLASTPHLSLCPKGSSPEPVPRAVLRAWDSTLSTELPSADAAWQWGRGGLEYPAKSPVSGTGDWSSHFNSSYCMTLIQPSPWLSLTSPM